MGVLEGGGMADQMKKQNNGRKNKQSTGRPIRRETC